MYAFVVSTADGMEEWEKTFCLSDKNKKHFNFRLKKLLRKIQIPLVQRKKFQKDREGHGSKLLLCLGHLPRRQIVPSAG
jgi:hypothetical protein